MSSVPNHAASSQFAFTRRFSPIPLILLWWPLSIFVLYKYLVGAELFFPALLNPLMLPPVQAANVRADGDGNGAEDGEDHRENDIANVVVWPVGVVHVSDARE